MENGQIKVLGIKKSEKDGKISYTLFGYSNFEEWENGTGYKTISEWTRSDLSSVKPGSIIIPIYGKGFQGKAVLCGVHVVAEK